MIEIEKKFLLTTMQQQVLLEGAQELGEKIVEDSYLDTDDYRLTGKDFWFRERNGSYELKAPLKSSTRSPSVTNRYHEITSIEEICHELQLDSTADFDGALASAGIKRFVTCFTSRKSYEKQGFHIDIDSVTYLNSKYVYALAEIELLVSNESEADEAERRIIEFAQGLGLVTNQAILGKVIAYLKSETPAHYDALVGAGVLR